MTRRAVLDCCSGCFEMTLSQISPLRDDELRPNSNAISVARRSTSFRTHCAPPRLPERACAMVDNKKCERLEFRESLFCDCFCKQLQCASRVISRMQPASPSTKGELLRQTDILSSQTPYSKLCSPS